MSYIDPSTGKTLLTERPREWKTVAQESVTYDAASARTTNTANGMVTTMDAVGRDTIGTSNFFRACFAIPGSRALYGLGCQMENYMNLLGHTLYLTQHNLKAMVPVLMSPDGFGLLFDAGCAMKYTSSQPAAAGGEFPEGVKDDGYKEYYTRMFQWGTFLPVLRSHGTNTPREIWRFGEPGTPYYDAILKLINLRYSLIPYIYSLASQQSAGSYSMARMLSFDWSADAEVLDLKDQYMFGDIMVSPVTAPLSESSTRRLRLPAGTRWTDWWTGKQYAGGQWLEMPLTLDRLPLFVPDGAIITTTPPAEHTGAQRCEIITVRVYPGADGSFTLYEDAGDGYAYERGECARITMKWNDRKKALTIGRREGSFEGMLKERVFVVETPDHHSISVVYSGQPVTVRF